MVGRLPRLSILMASHCAIEALPGELLATLNKLQVGGRWGRCAAGMQDVALVFRSRCHSSPPHPTPFPAPRHDMVVMVLVLCFPAPPLPPQALVLQSNLLSQLPPDVSRLTDLKALSLASNRLSSLPDALTALTGLRLLDVSHNALGSIPSGVGALSRLKSLKLHHNQLPTVPNGLSCLGALTELYLSHNPLPLNVSGGGCGRGTSHDLRRGGQIRGGPCRVTVASRPQRRGGCRCNHQLLLLLHVRGWGI